MNLRTRIAAGTTAAAMISTFGLAGTAAGAASSAPASTVAATRVTADLPVTGLLPDGSKFTGQLSQLAVSVVNGVPTLSGLLKGNGLPAAGAPFKTAITDAQAACKILNLTIAPIDLDLLGLVVHTDTIHATIDAVRGAGNLLGNLLCALTGALDPAAPGVPAAPGAVPTQLIAPILTEVISALNLGSVAPAPVAPAPVAPAPVKPAPAMPAPGMPA